MAKGQKKSNREIRKPKAEKPKAEVFCKGLRNSFGFDWDDKGRLIASENGPDANQAVVP